MRLCADTWFLLEISKGNEHAINILKSAENGGHILFVPVLAVSEIINILYQKGKSLLADSMAANLASIDNVHIINIDLDLAKEIAKVKHSLGLSLADASMVATYKLTNSDFFLAVDSDYKIALNQGVVRIKLLEELHT
jgi:predicted nucleic acid-binding protein